MRATVEIENIEEMRRLAGIDDIELREQIHHLRPGDSVRLTLLAVGRPASAETVLVRITSIRGPALRGKLASNPALLGLTDVHAGTAVVFTADHIHSVLRNHPGRGHRRSDP